MLKKMLTAAVLAIPLALGSLTAQADIIPTDGTDLNFSWSFNTGAGVTITGTGTLDATLTAGDDLLISVSLTNTTVVPAGDNMALMSFGFGINPDATAASMQTAGDEMIDAALDSIPSLALIEVCAWAGNNCSGGPVGDGIQAGGDSDSFTLLVEGTYGSTVEIDPIGFKFQGTVGSFEFTTTDREPPQENPAPGTLALFGLALLLGRFAMRRRTMLS